MSAANNLRDAMIEALRNMPWIGGGVPCPANIWDDAPEIADAILAILPQWTAQEPDLT